VLNLTSAVAAVYLVAILVFPHPALAFGLCGLAVAATAWMALRILNDPWSTDKTFDDQFYLDRDDLRRSGSG
jgi:hypothetical protein